MTAILLERLSAFLARDFTGQNLRLVPVFSPFDGGKHVIQCMHPGPAEGPEGAKIRAKHRNFNEFGLFWP